MRALHLRTGQVLPYRVRRGTTERPIDGPVGVASQDHSTPRTRPYIPEPTGKSGRPRETTGPRSLEAHSRKASGGRSRLKLLSLYAHNFKKLKFSQPLPFSEGISLITGLNESGKSTILDAILFALFGRMIRPSQKPSNEEILSYGTGEAQVRLEFAIGDLRYRVIREVHKTRPNRAQLYELNGDSRQKTLATTVNDTTSEIERLLGGITYNEIVASSVVAQKDLERLIKQRLDDRRKVVNVFLNLDSFNRVQDQLDGERSRIEGTTRNPGQLTIERERLLSLQDQLKRYREAETQLSTLAERIQRLKLELVELEQKFAVTDSLHKTLKQYDDAVKLKQSLRQEIQDKSRLAETLQRQLAGIAAQREELERAQSEINQYSGLSEIEFQLTQVSNILEEFQSAEIRRVQLEESRDSLQTKIAEKTKEASALGNPKTFESKPRRVWTYLISTSALGAGAVLSFFLGLPQVAVAFGSLAIASLLLLSRQIVSLSQQASSSRLEQEQMAGQQLIRSWENELAETQQNLTAIQTDIAGRSQSLLERLSSISRYSAKVGGTKDPKAVFETMSALFESDRQSVQALEAKVKLLGQQLKEEPQVKERLDLIQREIKQVGTKFKSAELPDLPEGLTFSETLLEETANARDGLKESVSRNRAQIEDSISRQLELRQLIEENIGLDDQVQTQMKKVMLLEKDCAVVKLSVKGLEQTSESLRNRVKPQVERYMGLILPVITSGKYKAVQLDEDYTARVFDPEAGEFKPKEVFSGGTEDQLLLAMRLAFALALIPQAKGHNPEFLFLDEPLGSSDRVRREGILALLHQELSQNFKQIFLISHVGDLEAEADTIIQMDNGAIREVVGRKSPPRQPVAIPA
ncbi:SMC family ATPase [Candidatus Bathyarchaeota archaeon]|nr:MAG: SMC family ATPase [Candidatus Bathyarchaeota archaeon]